VVARGLAVDELKTTPASSTLYKKEQIP